MAMAMPQRVARPALGVQAPLAAAGAPVGQYRRLEVTCQAGRAGPTSAASAVLDAATERPLADAEKVAYLQQQLQQLSAETVPAADAEGQYNQSGLNGLTSCGTAGLKSGVFQVTAAQPVSYVIQEKEDLFDLSCDELLRGVIPGSFPFQLTDEPQPAVGQRRFIVVDDQVDRIHGQKIRDYFDSKGVEYELLALPTQEANKDFELVYEIARRLEDFGINRRKEPIIAIGGGVCLDVVGLTANLFRRNTPVIKVPTTLMAAIDASIGIKTAVNFNGKKNKLGTYCPPLAVFIDRTFLRTLDARNLANGAAEMLKMACIKDAQLFGLLEQHAAAFIQGGFQGPVAGAAMRRSIQGMLEELEYNLWEHILCRLVDYGHTFSPELEMAALTSGLEMLHGEAVNIDMALTTQIAANRGLLSRDQANRVFSVMCALNLPFWHPVCSAELFHKGLLDTKKARDGLQRVPLMDGIGAAVFVNDVTAEEVAAAAQQLQTLAEKNGAVFGTAAVSTVVPMRAPVPAAAAAAL